MKRLVVIKNDERVGKLWLDQKRRFVFRYDEPYLQKKNPYPLSLSLPIRS